MKRAGLIRRSPGAFTLLLLLAGSLWLNGWLIQKVMDYKGRVFLAREFPDQVPHYVSRDGRQLIWMTGDSRISAWPMPDTPSRRFINRGVSGFTVRESLDQFRADLAAGSRPHTVIIQSGINDILSAGYNRPSRLPQAALEFQPGRPGPGVIMEQAAVCLKTLVQTARDAGVQVILLTVFPPGPAGLRDYFFWTAELDACVARLNESLRSLAGPGVTVMDAGAVLGGETRIRKEFSADMLHLNPQGYAALTSALEPLLAAAETAALP